MKDRSIDERLFLFRVKKQFRPWADAEIAAPNQEEAEKRIKRLCERGCPPNSEWRYVKEVELEKPELPDLRPVDSRGSYVVSVAVKLARKGKG